jgi:hypothetical protein
VTEQNLHHLNMASLIDAGNADISTWLTVGLVPIGIFLRNFLKEDFRDLKNIQLVSGEVDQYQPSDALGAPLSALVSGLGRTL